MYVHFLYPLGVISVAEELDYEITPNYLLKIQAKDKGDPPLTSHCTVNISVTDVNDNDPVFIQNSYTTIVSEDASISDRIIQVNM